MARVGYSQSITQLTESNLTVTTTGTVFGLWEEAGETRGTHREHEENMQTRPGSQTQYVLAERQQY